MNLLQKLFGTVNDRLLKKFTKTLNQVNQLEEKFKNLNETEVKEYTQNLKQKYQETKNLDEILPEAFALCRFVSEKTIGLRHYDSQILGGIALHKGYVTEMKTGEGKTLVCTLPAYLNALTENSVHVVTVNDYLAKRDSQWMKQLYQYLGMKVGNISDDTIVDHRNTYQADIIYGTNNQYGFDYLKDNLVLDAQEILQKSHSFAIIDEVDSILIDEARTPLIISGSDEQELQFYYVANDIVKKLKKIEYDIDEKQQAINLNDKGVDAVEKILRQMKIFSNSSNLFQVENIAILHHINQALRANYMMKKDVDYICKNNQVLIVDEFTGRVMEGRRYSDGLHQAIEAKEKINVQQESITLATITFQNYFKLYDKLAGMTGTALTEVEEFKNIYDLNVLAVPTHKKLIREDKEDQIYTSETAKFNAVVDEIKQANKNGQPILVGTASIEKSELISKMLKKQKIKHNVLNAKKHQQEAEIIAQAGRKKAVTIATNMAGRGTDIMLGGNLQMLLDEQSTKLYSQDDINKLEKKLYKQVEKEKKQVQELGGLYVIGTERHESRRIDNQLRGRSGRQGDPGKTQFFISLEDDLMRIFGSEKIKAILQKLGLDENDNLQHPWITRAIEKAQKKVEMQNYEVRKNLIKFDNILNSQREVLMNMRKKALFEQEIKHVVQELVSEVNEYIIQNYFPENIEQHKWNLTQIEKYIQNIYGQDLDLTKYAEQDGIGYKEIVEFINSNNEKIVEQKRIQASEIDFDKFCQYVYLEQLNIFWRNHLTAMSELKRGINLRAYGQKDPIQEYEQESYQNFLNSLENVKQNVVQIIARSNFEKQSQNQLEQIRNSIEQGKKNSELKHNDDNTKDETIKIGRNEPCPCRSGKKYKHCHGKLV